MCNPSAQPQLRQPHTFSPQTLSPCFSPFFKFYNSCLPPFGDVFHSILAHSLTKSLADRLTSVCACVSVCVCVCVCVRTCVHQGGSALSWMWCWCCWWGWEKKRSTGSPAWQERISRTPHTDRLRVGAAWRGIRHVGSGKRQGGWLCCLELYSATDSDFQGNISFSWRENTMLPYTSNLRMLELMQSNHRKLPSCIRGSLWVTGSVYVKKKRKKNQNRIKCQNTQNQNICNGGKNWLQWERGLFWQSPHKIIRKNKSLKCKNRHKCNIKALFLESRVRSTVWFK